MINPCTGKRWRRGDICPASGRVFKQFDKRKSEGVAWYAKQDALDRARNKQAEIYHGKMTDKSYSDSERDRKRALMRKRRELGLSEDMDRKSKSNPEYKARQSIYGKKYRATESARKRKSERENHLLITNPIYKLRRRMRSRLYQALRVKGWIKNGPSEKMLGCDYGFLRSYLEARFKTGMSWDNYGPVWHVDHFVPLSSAKDKRELEKLCKYTNLVPEFAFDNISKGAKQLKQLAFL